MLEKKKKRKKTQKTKKKHAAPEIGKLYTEGLLIHKRPRS